MYNNQLRQCFQLECFLTIINLTVWAFLRSTNLTIFPIPNNWFSVVIEPTWSIQAHSNDSTSINVTWPDYPVKTPSNYMAVCISKSDPTNLTVVATSNHTRSAVLGSLKKFSEYSVQVWAVLGNSSQENITNWNQIIRGSRKVLIKTDEDGKK